MSTSDGLATAYGRFADIVHRQAPLEVNVAELVDGPGLAKHAPFLVRVGEKAHQPPWEMAS